MKQQRLVVGMDGSKGARAALRWAVASTADQGGDSIRAIATWQRQPAGASPSKHTDAPKDRLANMRAMASGTRVVGAHSALRLRVGVGLFIFSWLPIFQVYVWMTGLSGSDAHNARLVVWGFQRALGIVGLVLAGAAAKTVVKRVGWRGLPKALWFMVRTGGAPELPPVVSNIKL